MRWITAALLGAWIAAPARAAEEPAPDGTASPAADAGKAPDAGAAGDAAAPEGEASDLDAAVVKLPPDDRDAAVPAGSLWNEVSARALIGMDGNARRVGDLITVNIYDETMTEILADTSTSRDSSVGGGIDSLFGLGTKITDANPSMGGEIGFSINGSSDYTGEGATRRQGKIVGSVTCEVVEVLPNKNLVIYGQKEVRVNRETQTLVVAGKVRPRDIQADNTVASTYIADSHIQFVGTGPVGDKQGPGVGTRVVDRVWPF